MADVLHLENSSDREGKPRRHAYDRELGDEQHEPKHAANAVHAKTRPEHVRLWGSDSGERKANVRDGYGRKTQLAHLSKAISSTASSPDTSTMYLASCEPSRIHAAGTSTIIENGVKAYSSAKGCSSGSSPLTARSRRRIVCRRSCRRGRVQRGAGEWCALVSLFIHLAHPLGMQAFPPSPDQALMRVGRSPPEANPSRQLAQVQSTCDTCVHAQRKPAEKEAMSTSANPINRFGEMPPVRSPVFSVAIAIPSTIVSIVRISWHVARCSPMQTENARIHTGTDDLMIVSASMGVV